MHTEDDYAPIVAQFVREHGIAEWADIFIHVESILPLDTEDYAGLDSDDRPRYQRIIRNLKSNRTLVITFADIINVSRGFATVHFARDNNIEECTRKNRVQRPRKPRKPKVDLDAKGEKAIREVWNKHFAMLRELYDSAIVLLDVRNPEMTVREFGIKYDLIKYLTPATV